MRDTRFIFIEGIPGSGKSTTAEFLTQALRRHGVATSFLPEGPTVDEPEHPLRVGPTLPHPLAPWLDLTVEAYRALSLQKWQRFVREVRFGSEVTVCDGLLFHGNLTDLLLMAAEQAALRDYVTRVLAVLAPLDPVAVYLRPPDVARALRAVCDARGEEWGAYQVGWKLSSPYAVQRSLQGFSGLVEFYEAYRALCDELFAELTIPKRAVHSAGDWSAAYRDVLSFLQVER